MLWGKYNIFPLKIVIFTAVIVSVCNIYEPHHEKTCFLHVRKQRRRSAAQISTFVFTIWIVQSLLFLNLKFQASSYLLNLYSPLSVGPSRKPRRHVFSRRSSYYVDIYLPKTVLLFSLSHKQCVEFLLRCLKVLILLKTGPINRKHYIVTMLFQSFRTDKP